VKARVAVSGSTRTKLLDAAGEVFAESGYYAATIREICSRAGANVAAVNYYFRDKLELYTEVLRQSVSSAHREALRSMREQYTPPEEVLRHVIHSILKTLYGADRPPLHVRLMARELVQPTQAMARIIDEVIRPSYDRLRDLIGAILGLPSDHKTTRLCTHSIIGQVAHYAQAGPFLARLWPEMKMTPEQLEEIADHITDFSLAYLRKRGAGRKEDRLKEKGGKRK